jgi:hypothetical protein
MPAAVRRDDIDPVELQLKFRVFELKRKNVFNVLSICQGNLVAMY